MFFHFLVAVSLVPGILLLFLCVLAKPWFATRPPGRQHLSGSWYYRIDDSRTMGCLGFSIYHDWPTPSVSPPFGPRLSYTPAVLAWYDKQPTGPHLRKLGFGYDHDTYMEVNATPAWVARGRYVSIGVPFWAAWVVGVLPVPFAIVIVRRVLIRRRSHRGLCSVCGYDLRVTPDRCPECGTAGTATPAVHPALIDSK